MYRYPLQLFFVLLLSVMAKEALSTTYLVGNTHTYKTPNDLYKANVIADKDTILIENGYYLGTQTLANWNKNRLVIKGINGQPELFADGAHIQGKGIWVLSGNNITVENIKFSGARVPDMNGSGIRLDGIGIIVRHCNFFNNENGILTSNPYQGHVLIEFSEFSTGGSGDGYSHNLYVGHVDTLTFRFNYSHHAIVGHALKSRANYNYIYFNRIMDELSGGSSRLIDLPNGGFSIVMGNLLQQGPDAVNSNLVGFGLEGLSNLDSSELYFIHNTCVNQRNSNGLFIDVETGTAVAKLINNIFAGYGSISNGPITENHHNYYKSNPVQLSFHNLSSFDYRLSSQSGAINYCEPIDSVREINLNPKYVYKHPLYSDLRHVDMQPDAGAYEYYFTAGNANLSRSKLKIFPNPSDEFIWIDSELNGLVSYFIYNSTGRMVQAGKLMDKTISIKNLPSGIYIIRIQNEDDFFCDFIQVQH